jgi:hypothetical protein
MRDEQGRSGGGALFLCLFSGVRAEFRSRLFGNFPGNFTAIFQAFRQNIPINLQLISQSIFQAISQSILHVKKPSSYRRTKHGFHRCKSNNPVARGR